MMIPLLVLPIIIPPFGATRLIGAAPARRDQQIAIVIMESLSSKKKWTPIQIYIDTIASRRGHRLVVVYDMC